MTEWDLLIFSKTLKEKQEGMQSSLTKIIDAMSGLDQEKTALAEVWKGRAKENFMSSFTKTFEKAAENVDEIRKLILAYSQIESSFENCEKEIMKLL